MEYVIGTVQKGNSMRIILKTKGDTHTSYSGRISLEQKRGHELVRDTFTVLEKYRSADYEGICYDWYLIADHYQTCDKSEVYEEQLEKLSADLAYVSMMADVDLGEEE